MKSYIVAAILIIIETTVIPCRPKMIPSEAQATSVMEYECKSAMPAWRGLVPGSSTKTEVDQILGTPVQASSIGLPNGQGKLYEYPPFLSSMGEKLGNRVAMGNDGQVVWIDRWIANADDRFFTIAELADTYGHTLDRVYVNGVGDVFGPEEVYVWAACGVAFTAVPAEYFQEEFEADVSLAPPPVPTNPTFNLVHPVPAIDTLQPQLRFHDLVLRAFQFPPTDYATFERSYESQILYMGPHYYRVLSP